MGRLNDAGVVSNFPSKLGFLMFFFGKRLAYGKLAVAGWLVASHNKGKRFLQKIKMSENRSMLSQNTLQDLRRVVA